MRVNLTRRYNISSLLNKALPFFISLVIILLLAFVMSSNKVNGSSIERQVSSIQILIVENNKFSNSNGVITNINQATNFSHLKQVSSDYILISLLTIFFIAVVNYRHFKEKCLPPPWYFILKYASRLSISGWKVSNVLYISKLLYKF